MKTLLKTLLIVLTMINISNNALASEKLSKPKHTMQESVTLEFTKIMYADEINTYANDICYEEFVKSKIPFKFVKPFVEMTKNNKKIGIEILGIGYLESGWKVFKGAINENGSFDAGPLMLNSYNVEDEYFMYLFASNIKAEYVDDIDIYYMCICINYYESLREQLGPWNALQVYNGGWRTIRNTCPQRLKRTVIKYANSVYNYINAYSEEWKEYEKQESETIKNYLARLYTNRALNEMCAGLNVGYQNEQKIENNSCDGYSILINHLYYLANILYNDEKYYKYFMLRQWFDPEDWKPIVLLAKSNCLSNKKDIAI